MLGALLASHALRQLLLILLGFYSHPSIPKLSPTDYVIQILRQPGPDSTLRPPVSGMTCI